MFDLIVRGGTIVDGTGVAPFEGDVAIQDGRIAAVGHVEGDARQEIDARGRIVTPGFVDIHTHYDGQATWDSLLSPTCWHGVTTLVMGNCGVGFAPVAPGQQDFLIRLMEGVEDIPGTALYEGIDWQWESFPEYLDALDRRRYVLDVGTQVPHGAVRAYVMGERGAKNEPATPEDIARQAAIVKEAIEAGALGFSMSRTIVHRAVDGEVVPGTHSAEDEIFGIARALGELGRGIVELAPAGIQGEDMSAPDREMDWMRRLSAEIHRPVSFGLVQHDVAPDDWKRLLDLCEAAAEEGAILRPQVSARPTTLLIGHQSFHPFSFRPTCMAMRDWPLEQRIAELRKPEVREKILNEKSHYAVPEMAVVTQMIENGIDKIFRLGDPPNYEPAPEESLKAIAEREGRDPFHLLYDWMLELDGRQLLMLTLLNYSDYDLESVRAMLEHPSTAFGLADGGAHCGAICDASMTTSMLEHWVKRRTRGPRLPIEVAVRKMTADTAALYGLNDRGRLLPGLKADLNVIDLDRLENQMPEVAYDLPAGAARFVQRARGYDATIVSGEVTFRDGEHTGALPGRLVRGARD
ncbi:MAG: amidohydrolase family protein [Spirochaetaceae bacterium]|nr:amidohydrolase family protein [Myxococcales bacterium]MCB9726283.1 amidohydrolase family protein [Spirochaetaceae bacterium]